MESNAEFQKRMIGMTAQENSSHITRLAGRGFKRLQDDKINLDKYMDGLAEAIHVRPVDSWADAVLDRLQNGMRYQGQPLPWPKLSGLFGLRPAEVTLWAGPGGTGKSLLTTQTAIKLAQAGERICIASMEMPPEITAYRLVRQALGGYPPHEEDVLKILKHAGKHIWLYEQVGIVRWPRLVALARYCAAELGITQFFIDSLMKCGIPKDDYNGQIAFVDGLCALAKETKLHIHLISHTRKGQGSPQSRDNQDVRGASEITDLVDNVMMLSRNLEKERETQEASPKPEIMAQSDALLTCGKDRHGEWQGYLKLWYHSQAMMFLDSVEATPIPMAWPREPGCDDDLA